MKYEGVPGESTALVISLVEPPDQAPVPLVASFSFPIVIPFYYMFRVLLESLLYGVLLLHCLRLRDQPDHTRAGAIVLCDRPETQRLLELYGAALQGRPTFCLLTAPAGLGKSALLASVIERLKTRALAQRPRVLVAQASQTLRNIEPLNTCRQFLRRWMRSGMFLGETCP